MTVHTRRRDWMQTCTGAKFWPLDPRPEDVRVSDIAHHLSLICRFGGATRTHYSVAQHSVIVAKAAKDAKAPSLDVFAALLHDAAEAYLGDVIRPIKHSRAFAGYRLAEPRVHAAICRRFGVRPDRAPDVIRWADEATCAAERRDLFDGGGIPWSGLRARALAETIIPISPIEAELLFLRWFISYAPTLDLLHEADAACAAIRARAAVSP